MNLTEIFLKFSLQTGVQWVMYILIFCSILNFAIILDRILYFLKYRGDFAEFIQNLTSRLNSNESLDKISAWCSGQKMLESSVASVGLEFAQKNEKAAEQSMMATMIAAKTRFEKGTIILGTLGNNTPFIGLFGTIIGIMQAFHALSVNTNSGPEAVMASVAEALSATAIGILVAVPAVVAYNFFNRAIKKKIANSDTTAKIILSYLDSKKTNSVEESK
jgi:biopolymer transport protein ExbB